MPTIKKLLWLLCSFAALALCANLTVGTFHTVGTTYALSAGGQTTEGSVISTGDVDVAVYWSEDMTTWQNADAVAAVFGGSHWEPGYTQVRYIKIVNEGELAFTYQLQLQPTTNGGSLAQALEIYQAETDARYTQRDALIAPANYSGTLAALGDKAVAEGTLAAADPDESVVYAVALRMAPTAGNTYNGTGSAEYLLKVTATNEPITTP